MRTNRILTRITQAAAACGVNFRNPALRRAQGAFGVMWAGEWAATVALGVIAFRHGGAAAVGLVGVARMIPSAFGAPIAATVADRVRRERVLASVGVTRACAFTAAAVIVFANGPVVLVYIVLVVATVAQTLFRPAHSALLPTLCSTPAELTSANVVRGLLDSIATLVGPLTAALLLKTSGPGAVFVAVAAGSALAAALTVTLRYDAPPRLTQARAAHVVRESIGGVTAIAADRGMALLTALATLQTFTRGALTVLTVVVAIKLLGIGQPGVGVLTAAVGAGAVGGSLSASLLVGRGGLARWFGVGVALWGVPLALIGAIPHLWAAIPALAVIGVGNALVDVGVFTLLARLADDSVLARVFAAFEGIITLGVAAGALVTPGLIAVLGIRGALALVGIIAPVGVIVAWRTLRALDGRLRVRDADVALLQNVPMLRSLPEATIEQLAAGLTRSRLARGKFVFEQGDQGDDFFVIEEGQAEVIGDGLSLRMLGRGDGFGEIALLRGCRRTASVRATVPLVLGVLNRTLFVAAVSGYSRSSEIGEKVISDHLSHFRPEGSGD